MGSHFLDNHAKRVNDDVWLELSFDLLKLKRAANNENIAHEKILNESYTQISELTNIGSGSDNLSDVMARTVTAVRGFEAFELVYRNLSKQL